MDKKSQWANEVIDSLKNIKKAAPSDDLFAKIVAQIPQDKAVKVLPLYRLYWIAATACIVITINIYALNTETKSSNEEAIASNELLSDYSIYN